MKKNQNRPFYNPFRTKEPEEVWRELLAKAKPITKDEFLQRVKEVKKKTKN